MRSVRQRLAAQLPPPAGTPIEWAQAASRAIATASAVDRWTRAIFAGRVVPAKQQREWLALISTRTGKPIGDVTPADPSGRSGLFGR